MIIKAGLEMKLSVNIDYLERQAKEVFKALEKFSNEYFLPVNISKPKEMIIYNALKVTEPVIKYKGIYIEYITSFKSLAVEIGTKISLGEVDGCKERPTPALFYAGRLSFSFNNSDMLCPRPLEFSNRILVTVKYISYAYKLKLVTPGKKYVFLF